MLARSSPISSLTYNLRARRTKTAAMSAHMRQSRNSLASANVERATASRGPCCIISRVALRDMLQCRADSHGKSVGRRREQGTDPRKKIRGIYDRRHNDPRISETRRSEGDPSVARISFGRHSYPIVRGWPWTVADVLGKPGKAENSQKNFKSKNLENLPNPC